ncbi:MAG: glycosyltransferase family 39 protein [Ignavibacteriaceae bacterium]
MKKRNNTLYDYYKSIFNNNKFELLLFLSLTLLLFAVRVISGFNGLYGQDAYEYLRYTGRLTLFFQKGVNPGEFFWPVGYPFIASLLNLIINNGTIALQAGSFLSYLFSVVYLYKILKLLNINNKIKLYIILFFCFSPFIFRTAFLLMAESLSVLCITALTYHIIEYSIRYRLKDFSLAVLFIMLSAITRYADLVIIFIPSVFLLITFLKHFKLTTLLSGILIIILTLLPHIIINQDHSMNFLGHEWLREWSLNNYISHGFYTDNGYESYSLINILYPFANLVYPEFVFCGLIFIVFIKMRDFNSNYLKIFAASLLVYYIFLAGIPYQNFRFLIPSFPFVLIILYPGYEKITGKYLKGKSLIIISLIVLIIQVFFIYKYSAGIYTLNKFEKETADVIKQFDGTKTLYTFYLNGALYYYGVKNPLVNLYDKKLIDVPAGSYILFNESKFNEQWKNKLPMINWLYIKSNYKLRLLHRFTGGWTLFGTI